MSVHPALHISNTTHLSLASAASEYAWVDWIITTCLFVALAVLAGVVHYFSPEEADSQHKDQWIRSEHETRVDPDKDHGVLQTNYEKEHIEFGKSHMFQFSKKGMHGKERVHKKMLHYDIDRTTGWSSLFNLSGSCVADRHVWATCSVYWILTAVIVVLVIRVPNMKAMYSMMAPLTSLAGYFSAILGFMLGLFVSAIIQRWWECRMNCIEPFWASLSDVQLFLSCRCSLDDAPVKETILRLFLLSHRLIYHECRSSEGLEYMTGLVKVGLMTEKESEYLVGRPAKSQIVLVWIGRLAYKLQAKKKWGNDEMLFLDEQIRRARNAIGKVFAYCNTQLPFQYVHLLTFCILLCNLIVSLKCGLMIAQAWGDVPLVLLQILQIVIEPFAYHSFMRLCAELANPFGHDFSDFPGFAYHCHMRAEGMSIHKAGDEMPEELETLV